MPPDPWILCCPSPKDLAVRLGFDLCAEEKAFLSRRKQVVAKALKQALQLDGDLQEDEVRGWAGWVQSPMLNAVPGCSLTKPELVPSQAWACLLSACPCLLPSLSMFSDRSCQILSTA